MGLSDREYYREQPPAGFSIGGQRSMVTTIIIINVAVYLFDVLFTNQQYWLSDMLGMKLSSLTQPWNWWQLVTAGFAHDPHTIYHVGVNMLVLFFFGREIEGVYGRREFLRLYLTMIVFSFFCWAVIAKLVQGLPEMYPVSGEMRPLMCYGASGAVAGMFLLFALHFPRRQVLLFFVIPAPAWVAGGIAILFDMFGATHGEGNVAHWAHLAGFAFAAVYYFGRWNLSRVLPDGLAFSRNLLRRRPSLRVHTDDAPYPDLAEEADRILEKVHRLGEASLTPKERRTLEGYSRRIRQKHR